MSTDRGYHDDHNVDNEEFLRAERVARRYFFPPEVEADDNKKGENSVEEEGNEVQEKLRLNHLRSVGKPIGVPDNEECTDQERTKRDSRVKRGARFWHLKERSAGEDGCRLSETLAIEVKEWKGGFFYPSDLPILPSCFRRFSPIADN